jgi:hypothetical protein
LLQLPGELRNRIYEYALTSDDAQLLYREDAPPIIPDVPLLHCEQQILSHISSKPTASFGLYEWPCTKGFNQLKYTNRQVRKETKGLEVRYNGLLFLEQNDTDAPLVVRESASIIQCARLLHHCRPRRASKIRKIVMKSVRPAL